MYVLCTGRAPVEALSVLGGKDQYQNSRREYLEFVFPQERNTVEDVDLILSSDNCVSITLSDPETGEQFIHEGYVVRGPVRVFCDEDGVWKIAIKRYQQTEMERELAQVKSQVAALMTKMGV